MTHIRLLHSDGRLIAVNKNGYWHKLDGVGQHEFGYALQNGDVEDISPLPEVTNRELVDFAVTIGVCLVILMCGMFLFNVGC